MLNSNLSWFNFPIKSNNVIIFRACGAVIGDKETNLNLEVMPKKNIRAGLSIIVLTSQRQLHFGQYK